MADSVVAAPVKRMTARSGSFASICRLSSIPSITGHIEVRDEDGQPLNRRCMQGCSRTRPCGHGVSCPTQSPAEGLDQLDVVIHNEDWAVFGRDASRFWGVGPRELARHTFS